MDTHTTCISHGLINRDKYYLVVPFGASPNMHSQNLLALIFSWIDVVVSAWSPLDFV